MFASNVPPEDPILEYLMGGNTKVATGKKLAVIKKSTILTTWL